MSNRLPIFWAIDRFNRIRERALGDARRPDGPRAEALRVGGGEGGVFVRPPEVEGISHVPVGSKAREELLCLVGAFAMDNLG